MSGDDREGERGRSKAPPPRTGKTIQGMPSVSPPVEPTDADTDADELPHAPFGRNRVTMDFSGPPLTLPEDPPEEYGREAERTGWASELDSVPAPDDGPHDAWALDRKRRSTPPVAMPAVVVPPPRAAMPPLPRPPSGERSWSVPPTLPAHDEGDALGLVDRSRASQPTIDLAAEMAERYALDDFTGALRTAELLLGADPSNVEAQRYAQSCRDRLFQLYSSRLGPLTQLVQVVVPDREVRWLGLDHRAGFLLSRIDGEHSVEELIDISGMPRLEALKTLAGLVDAGAVRLRPA